MNTRLLLAHALSPVHCGTGQAIGGIDLPIAREKPTRLPLVPGSSLKGVLRSRGRTDDPMTVTIFGPETEHAADHAGSVQISDLLLVFLPVRSIRGTFAWVTAPFVLRRFARDAREAGLDLGALPPDPDGDHAVVTGQRLRAGDRIVFEDFDFQAREDASFGKLAEQVARWLHGPGNEAAAERRLFVERACLVADDVMGLLLETCTEIAARIRIDPDKGTVARGALWTEEALPVESVLAGLVVATPVRQRGGAVPEASKLLDQVEQLASGTVQLGGNATVGRGLCRLRLVGKEG